MGLQVLAAAAGGSSLPADVVLSTAATLLVGSRVTGDTNDRFQILADGTHKWGPGNGATDLTAARSGVGILAVTGSLTTSAGITAQLGNATQVRLGDVGSGGAAAIDFGTLADAFIQRMGAQDIKAFGIIRTSFDIRAQDGNGTQVAIGSQGPSSQAGITLGSGGDTKLYRSASATATAVGTLLATANIAASIGGNTEVRMGSLSAKASVGLGPGQDTMLQRMAAGVLLLQNNQVAVTAPTMTGAGLMLENVVTAPSTNPVGAGVIYCDAGALKYRGTGGTVTTIAPA